MRKLNNMMINAFWLKVSITYDYSGADEEIAELHIIFEDLNATNTPYLDEKINIDSVILADNNITNNITNAKLAMLLKELHDEDMEFECIFTNNAILIITENYSLEIIEWEEEE